MKVMRNVACYDYHYDKSSALSVYLEKKVKKKKKANIVIFLLTAVFKHNKYFKHNPTGAVRILGDHNLPWCYFCIRMAF